MASVVAQARTLHWSLVASLATHNRVLLTTLELPVLLLIIVATSASPPFFDHLFAPLNGTQCL